MLVVGGEPSGAFAPLKSAELFDPATLAWTSAGSMVATGRTNGHTATLLPDGRVLVAAAPTPAWRRSASVEVFNPAGGGSWSTAGQMSEGRTGHTATLLNDGRVLVVSGQTPQVKTAGVELFDPAAAPAAAWSSAAALPILTGRERHTATLLPNGEVLVAGGYDGDDAADGPRRHLHARRRRLARRRAGDGVGACLAHRHPAPLRPGPGRRRGRQRRADRAVHRRDGWLERRRRHGRRPVGPSRDAPAERPGAGGRRQRRGRRRRPARSATTRPRNSWSDAGALALSVGAGTLTLLHDGSALATSATGGAARYTPATNSWTATGSLATPRASATATLLSNGLALVAGGVDANGVAVAAVELYDPATGAWRPGPSLIQARWGHTATLLPTGKVLVVGGWSAADSPIAGAELYDPLAERVESWPPPGGGPRQPHGDAAGGRPETTASGAAQPRSGRLLVVGGEAARRRRPHRRRVL